MAVDINAVVEQVVELTRPRSFDIPQERGVSIQIQTHLLKSLTDILRQDGHTTVGSEDGHAGIRIFAEAHASATPFEVVITDLGMPKMDGRRVALEVRSIDPSVPIVMLTGWGHRMIADQDTPSFVDRVLSKPPKVQDLRRALMELMCREDSSSRQSNG